MIIGEKNTDLKRLTGQLKLRFLTEIGRFHWNQAKKSATSPGLVNPEHTIGLHFPNILRTLKNSYYICKDNITTTNIIYLQKYGNTWEISNTNYKEGEGRDPINWFNSLTFLYLSQTRTWISNTICCRVHHYRMFPYLSLNEHAAQWS
jgi:hypothetical protein